MIALLVSVLISGQDPATLEESGALWQAGAAWQAQGSIEGQARVVCRLLEGALYAGHANRASWLLEEMESLNPEPGLVTYWNARLAWTCGLDSLAEAMLHTVAGDPWIEHRAAGTAMVYEGRPADAVSEFQKSLACASTRRREFWSAVDLCFALVEEGDAAGASEVCGILESSWPSEGLPHILRALILRVEGRDQEAGTLLTSLLASSDAAVADMAGSLLRE